MYGFHQRIYELIFGNLKKYSKNLSIRTKRSLLGVSFVIVICAYILNCDIYNFSFRSRNMIYAVAFIILLITLQNNENKLLSPKGKFIIGCLYVLGGGSVIASIANGVTGYFFYGLVYLFLLPIGIIMFNHGNFNEIILSFSKCSVVFFFIIAVSSFLFKPIVEGQYSSVFGDPNLLGLFCVETVISGMYLIKCKKWKKTAYGIIFFAVSFCYISGSRTSALAIICIIIIEAIYWVKFKKISFVKIVKVIIGITITVYITMFILINITPGLVNLESGLRAGDKISVHEIFNYNIKFSFNETTDDIVDKNLKGIKDNDSFTAGRTDIWKETIHSLNAFGHNTELVKGISYFNKPMYVHNGILQIWYSMGIIPAIGFILIMGFTGISALKILCNFTSWTNKNIFIIEVIGATSIFVMFFSIYFAFMNPLIYMYHIILFDLANHCSVDDLSKERKSLV